MQNFACKPKKHSFSFHIDVKGHRQAYTDFPVWFYVCDAKAFN